MFIKLLNVKKLLFSFVVVIYMFSSLNASEEGRTRREIVFSGSRDSSSFTPTNHSHASSSSSTPSLQRQSRQHRNRRYRTSRRYYQNNDEEEELSSSQSISHPQTPYARQTKKPTTPTHVNVETNLLTQLYNSVLANDYSKVESLLNDPTFTDHNTFIKGLPVLHIAIQKQSSLKTVQLLCSHPKVNIKVQDVDGNTPLHYIQKNDVIDILIENGADLSIVNNIGKTALELAQFRGLGEVILHMQSIIDKPKRQEALKLFEERKKGHKQKKSKTSRCPVCQGKVRIKNLSKEEQELHNPYVCDHKIHQDCFENLLTHSKICPFCRENLKPTQTTFYVEKKDPKDEHAALLQQQEEYENFLRATIAAEQEIETEEEY